MAGSIGMVVGGANGVGAAAVKKLLSENYDKVYVVDRAEPEFICEKTEFIRFNLISDDVRELSRHTDVDTLIITAGVGRLDYFQNITTTEIETSFRINSIAVVELVQAFYSKIASNENFYCAVMSSIAGIVSSPLYSVYSATKAAVSRFLESINSELSGQGFSNRILSVCPGSIKGTKFHGAATNDFSLIMPLVDEIYDKMVEREEEFVPNFEVYGDVIRRYKTDAKKFGLESYQFKLEKNNLETKPKVKVGYLTGSFDLFHIGHLNLLRRAKQYCDYLVVGVHTDGSHKGKELYIPLSERMEIVNSVKYVDRVIECTQSDLDAYEEVKYDYLFVGSDYKGTDRFNHYEEVLKPLGVEVIYFPYTKGTSSTQLRDTLSHK